MIEEQEYRRIGIIELENLFEENNIDKLDVSGKNGGLLYIDVYNKEGDYIPHFYFYTKDKKIDGCMQIFRPDYFVHGRHKSILTNKQLKQLIKFLGEYKYEIGNNWQRIALAWYDSNSENKYKPILKYTKDPTNIANMPDYTKLLK